LKGTKAKKSDQKKREPAAQSDLLKMIKTNNFITISSTERKQTNMDWKDFYERIPGMLHNIKQEEFGKGNCAVMILNRGMKLTTCLNGGDCDMAASVAMAMCKNEGLRNVIMMASEAYMSVRAGKKAEDRDHERNPDSNTLKQ
jgi:hypothetical protein